MLDCNGSCNGSSSGSCNDVMPTLQYTTLHYITLHYTTLHCRGSCNDTSPLFLCGGALRAGSCNWSCNGSCNATWWQKSELNYGQWRGATPYHTIDTLPADPRVFKYTRIGTLSSRAEARLDAFGRSLDNFQLFADLFAALFKSFDL